MLPLQNPSLGAGGCALGAALLWGGGDFSGGMGVKAAGGTLRDTLRVVLAAHLLSLLVLLGLLIALHTALAPAEPLVWALGAGLSGGLGLLAFYLALASGTMGPAAALSGLIAAAIPACVSALTEGRPPTASLLGFILAAVAIWLIATPVHSPDGNLASRAMSRRVTWLAVAGGVGFGIYFVALRFANTAGALQPMAAARSASIVLCGCLLLVLRPSGSLVERPHSSWLSRQACLWVAGVALLDTGGNLLFLEATRLGRLDNAAVLASLYPASTILLAALVLHERPARHQIAGMVLAVVAVVLIAR